MNEKATAGIPLPHRGLNNPINLSCECVCALICLRVSPTKFKGVGRGGGDLWMGWVSVGWGRVGRWRYVDGVGRGHGRPGVG